MRNGVSTSSKRLVTSEDAGRTFLRIYKTTRRHILEDSNFHSDRSENLEYRIPPQLTLSRVCVTTDGVWIGDSIY
jgi:hypothetical protein